MATPPPQIRATTAATANGRIHRRTVLPLRTTRSAETTTTAPQATEAIYLLARHAFDDLRYRRLEWKCNALNAGSRRAAERLGFSFEGVFRQHMIIKGRNRDTAWYAITDNEWPAIRRCFEDWLAPANFDPDGRQRQSLSELIREAQR